MGKRVIAALCLCAVMFSMIRATAVFANAVENTVPTEQFAETVTAPVEETTPPETEPTEAPVAEPEATEAEATEPEASEPEATEPEATETATEPAETVPEETVPLETEAVDPYAPRSYCDIPLYLQTDYPNVRYGSGSIATSGCSVTSLAMVATYLTGHTYMPDELADYFSDYNSINHMEKLEYMSDMLQLPWKKAENYHEAMNAMYDGKIVIALMNKKSIFTEGQHFIVWAGVNDNGKIWVNDPNAGNYSLWNLKNAFVEGFSEGDLSCGYSGAWIYDPSAMPAEPFIYTEEEIQVECRYPDVELTLEEQNLLARMVWVEAQGEPFEGQQAIAEVVLNRLKAENFPDTVDGIIYADNQFRSVGLLDEAKPTSIQYEAVERALEGPYVLPEDVVFFATYPVNENVWGTIGGHVFCYQWDN